MNVIDAVKAAKRGAIMHSKRGNGYIRYKDGLLDIGARVTELAGKKCNPFVDFARCFDYGDIVATDYEKVKPPEHEKFWGYKGD